MVNKSFIFKLREIINESKYFSNNDFTFFEEYSNLKILYAYDETYFFELRIPNEMSILTRTEKETNTFGLIGKIKDIEYNTYEFSGRVNPGSISENEHFKFEGDSKIKQYLIAWINNLWNELTIKPEFRKLNELEIELEKINAKFENISDDYFTIDEVDKLNEKLESLEQQFEEKLEQEIKDKEKLNSILEELHNEIQKLKGQTKVLNKKNWFKSLSGKIFTWVSKEENRKFLKDTKDFIKPLLPDSIDNLI